MLTFKNLINEIQKYYSTEIEKFNGQNVLTEKGKYGMLPSKVPCIWIYAEPFGGVKNYNNYYVMRTAKITLFAICGSKQNTYDAVADSLELAEYCESLITALETSLNASTLNKENTGGANIKYGEIPIEFDSTFSDIAASRLEFFADYYPYVPEPVISEET